ncbi:MAG: YdcF family protein [Rhodobacteraceae bacterium]|nr:YdcF family protein [Paracoccaceae bacterium]
MADNAFFVISKLVGLLLMAETWLLLVMALGLLALWRGRLGIGRACLTLALAATLVLGALPLGSLLMAPLEAEYPADPPLDEVTGIILLGGWEGGFSDELPLLPQINDAGDRLLAAAMLARRFPEASIVITGGTGQILPRDRPVMSNAARGAAILEGLGLAPGRMIVEGASRNTVENARLSHALVRPGPADRWVLVTSAFHMGRSMQSFESAGWANLVAYPVDFRADSFRVGIGWDMQDKLRTLNLALKEHVGRIVYDLAGR